MKYEDKEINILTLSFQKKTLEEATLEEVVLPIIVAFRLFLKIGFLRMYLSENNSNKMYDLLMYDLLMVIMHL